MGSVKPAFPPAFDRAGLGMCFIRGHHINAAVRPDPIIGIDGYYDRLPGVLNIRIYFLQQLLLEDPVNPFSNGIIPWITALGHADPDSLRHQ